MMKMHHCTAGVFKEFPQAHCGEKPKKLKDCTNFCVFKVREFCEARNSHATEIPCKSNTTEVCCCDVECDSYKKMPYHGRVLGC